VKCSGELATSVVLATAVVISGADTLASDEDADRWYELASAAELGPASAGRMGGRWAGSSCVLEIDEARLSRMGFSRPEVGSSVVVERPAACASRAVTKLSASASSETSDILWCERTTAGAGLLGIGGSTEDANGAP
jgi:hypothetical protein